MAISKNNDRINIVISKEEKKLLEQIAKEEKRSVSNISSKIITEYLKEKGYLN